VLRHSNSDSISQTRSEISQFNDISDEKIFYDTEITSIIDSTEFIKLSKFSNSLLTSIIFPDLPAKAKNKNLNLILQIQKQMQEQQKKQQ
jgi:hypothetical protein